MESIDPKAWQYGVLGVVALAFAYAIIHLFRALRTDAKERIDLEKSFAKERSDWGEREVALRAEYEEKHRGLLENYNKALNNEREANRAHEDKIREEFAEIMEKNAAAAERASDALVNTLQKFHDRFTGSSRGRY